MLILVDKLSENFQILICWGGSRDQIQRKQINSETEQKDDSATKLTPGKDLIGGKRLR